MRRIAFLVGNKTFGADSSLPNLKFPDHDVEQLAALLRNPEVGRYDRVETLVDASRSEIMETFDNLLRDEKDALFLFYYSGHGIPSPAGGRLYLASSDTCTHRVLVTAMSYDE